MAKTKIICTLGPASGTETIIRKMVLLGMDVARLNFSHGSHEEHKARLDIVRTINKKYRRHIRILQDLEGHRIRIGRLKSGAPITLKKKQMLWLLQDRDYIGGGDTISFDYAGPIKDIKPGQFIYIDDGRIALKVKDREGKRLKAEVIIGGMLEERQGINMPGARLFFKGISAKDKQDIEFGVKNRVDYIAQSFIRNERDVLEVRKLVEGRLPECRIISKIENREGIRNIDSIIDASGGIMIARGDMGVSIPIYEIPMVQKSIIKKCNRKNKPVITATQMLEHMVDNMMPTRAEVTDIANAILDGTDFVMLSAETARGKYPVEAVEVMSQVINFTEKKTYSIGRYYPKE